MKQRLVQFINLFRVSIDDPDLLRAQFQSFRKQVPLLYFILSTSTILVSLRFMDKAPLWQSLYLPLSLCALTLIRALWWSRNNHKEASLAEIIRHLKVTNILSIILTLIMVLWAVSLYPHGDAYDHGHLAFYLSVTEIGCIFCLMNLRSAALNLMVVSSSVYAFFFILSGENSLQAMAVNLILVAFAMTVLLFTYFRDFNNLVISRRDLLAQKKEAMALSDENFKIANIDALTNLPNRRCFFTNLDKLFDTYDRRLGRIAVGVIDLDGFKPVNDSYGHLVGDQVLVEMAKRMNGLAIDGMQLARLGGDEFGIIVTGNPSDIKLKTIGRSISDVVSLPFSVGANQVKLGCSVGFATYPETAATAEQLFEHADYALYFAKRIERGQTILFSAEHEAEIKKLSLIEQTLLSANLEQELDLQFQPIVDTLTGRTMAFEALARWNSPSLGRVNPNDVIIVAERKGIIRQVTKILLQKALICAQKWPTDVRLSFNLSAHDICVAEGALQLIALVNQSGIDPHRLDFEITETTIAYDFAQAHSAVVALKAMGVGISLDDFGLGFSSLSHVHRLPLDKLKVDRSFVTDINDNSASLKIVKSLTALCADMNLTCIIEGVETESQLRTLRDLGCHNIQGYLFSKPMSEADTLLYLERERKNQRPYSDIAI